MRLFNSANGLAKVNIQLYSYRRQNPVDDIKKQFNSDIALWSNPFPFHNTSQRLHNVQMRRIREYRRERDLVFPIWDTFALFSHYGIHLHCQAEAFY